MSKVALLISYFYTPCVLISIVFAERRTSGFFVSRAKQEGLANETWRQWPQEQLEEEMVRVRPSLLILLRVRKSETLLTLCNAHVRRSATIQLIDNKCMLSLFFLLCGGGIYPHSHT